MYISINVISVSTEYLSSIRGIAQFINLIDILYNPVYNQINILKRNTMRKSTRSILQEISDIGLARDPDLVIESRGSNIIQSAINLLDMIRENYDVETAAELERRFINSIKGADPTKFKRGIKRIQESRE
jgi:hypothetical protein